jgi:uncharacterized membrane protein
MDFSQLLEFVIPIAERLSAIRAILGFILVFFLPGFAWTLVFFSRINIIERVALSFGLSLASVTLSLMALHVLFGLRITGANSVLTIIVITIIALVVYLLKRFVTRPSGTSNGDKD